MISKDVKYTDFNGEEHTERFWFHLSKSELLEWSVDGTQQALEGIKEGENPVEVLKAIKRIALKAVGRKSEDGKRFVKTDEIRADFEHSPAFDEMIVGMFQDVETMVNFIRSLIPNDLQEKLGPEFDKLSASAPVEDNRPAWEKEHREPTPQELKGMTREQLRELYAKKLGR